MNEYQELLKIRRNGDAYTEWETYRKSLTDFIIANSEPDSGIGLFGAGRCDDLDLRLLSAYFQRVTLIDRDPIAMEAALKRYNLTGNSHVSLQVFDFVGIREDQYLAFTQFAKACLQEFRGHGDWNRIEQSMKQYVDQMYRNLGRDIHLPGTFDYAVAAGIHSQLNEMSIHLWEYVTGAAGIPMNQEEDPVCSRINEETYGIVKRFNRLLMESAHRAVFLAYEAEIIGQTTEIQGVLQLKDDLRSLVRQGRIAIKEQDTAIWPQNKKNGTVFRMDMVKLQSHMQAAD